MHQRVADMMRLFQGYESAYGLYTVKDSGETKKKGNAATKNGPVTAELWNDHLCGKQGLGIIPINENNQVYFGAIDIDDYTAQAHIIALKIHKNKLPLVMCRSKSGGWHLYIFFSSPVPAALAQSKLREFSALLGYGNSEIYPKQTQLLVARGDQGSWINMPYFNETETDRYAVDTTCRPLSLDAFLTFVGPRVVDETKLLKIDSTEQVKELSDGPPCLQQLIVQGFPLGTRNNGLLNYGIYAKKLQPDTYAQLVEQFNTKYMDPPLQAQEVLAVVKSLRNKDYNYTCKQPPICAFCNSAVCRTRKHGVGGGSGMPAMGSLTKINTDPPLWFIDIEGGGRLELTTEQLQSSVHFQKRCMEVLNIMPGVMKRDGWEEVVQGLLENVHIVEMPPEASPVGQLLEHLETFLTSRAQGKSFDDLLLGKPVLFDDRHYFRMKDFMGYLERMKFKEFKVHKIAVILQDHGARHEFKNIRDRGVNHWSAPEIKNPKKKLDQPKQGGEF